MLVFQIIGTTQGTCLICDVKATTVTNLSSFILQKNHSKDLPERERFYVTKTACVLPERDVQ
jgi:hypothetical protein